MMQRMPMQQKVIVGAKTLLSRFLFRGQSAYAVAEDRATSIR